MIYMLPQKVAELMKYGIVIELMDGDNSFIPCNWITAVL